MDFRSGDLESFLNWSLLQGTSGKQKKLALSPILRLNNLLKLTRGGQCYTAVHVFIMFQQQKN